MTHESLLNRDWRGIVERLGGAASLETSARETKAFLRARVIETAVDLLRLVLAYCLGMRGLRSTAAWATSIGLVDISNVALLYRLRQCGDWLALLVGRAARLRRTQGEPRPADPHHRCQHGPQGRQGRQDKQQGVAHPQRF